VISWRRWLDKFGSALPVLPKSAADIPPLLPREVVFDRYNQHTKNCPHCSAALRRATVAAGALGVLAVVAAATVVVAAVGATALAAGGSAAAGPLAGASAGLKAAGFKLAAGGAGVAVVAGLLVEGLLRFRQLFIFQDYVHAEMH